MMMLGGLDMFLMEGQDQGPTMFMKTSAGTFAPITPRPGLSPFASDLYTQDATTGQMVQTYPFQLKPQESTLDKIGKVFASIGAAAPAVATTYESFKKPPACVPPQQAVFDQATGQWKCQAPGAGGGGGSAIQTNWGAVALVGGGFVVAGVLLYLVFRKKK
jgi:hypothetical protein